MGSVGIKSEGGVSKRANVILAMLITTLVFHVLAYAVEVDVKCGYV